MFAYVSNDALDVLDRGARHDAVTQVEDVPRASGGLVEHLLHAGLQ
jgi:hypothetical protein